ncbi:MAG: hypothetical protein Q9200_007002 [Gallowayella weberi]
MTSHECAITRSAAIFEDCLEVLLPHIRFDATMNNSKCAGGQTLAMSRRFARPQLPAIETYLSNDEDSRLPRQLASQSTLPEADRIRADGYRESQSRSCGTSMLLSAGDHTRDSMTQDLAALTRASSSRSPTSIASSMAARHLDSLPLLEQDQAGALIIAPPRRSKVLECPFNLLFCYKDFADTNLEEWILHSLTHFRHGSRPVLPPTSNQCVFCPAVFESPDFKLYTYLWNHRVISDADYRDIRANSEDRSRHVAAYPTPPVSPNERSAAVAQTAYSSSRRALIESQWTAR